MRKTRPKYRLAFREFLSGCNICREQKFQIVSPPLCYLTCPERIQSAMAQAVILDPYWKAAVKNSVEQMRILGLGVVLREGKSEGLFNRA